MIDRLLSELRYRWRALVYGERLEDDLRDEIGFHLEQEAAKLQAAGMAPDDARRAARLAFGGVESVKEATRDARGTMFLEQTWADLRYVLRTLAARRAFTLGVVGTLALGIGANVAVFGIVDRLMLRTPQGLRDADRVHRVHLSWTTNGERRMARNIAYARLMDLGRDTRSFDLIAGFQIRRAALGRGDDTREGAIAIVTANYVEFFDAPPVIGRWFTSAEDAPPAGAAVAVISHAHWQARYGGRDDVLGQTLQVDRVPATIIGVAPPGFTGIADGRTPLVFVPATAFAHAIRGPHFATAYNWSWIEVLARRRADVSVDAAAADIANAFRHSLTAEAAAEAHSLVDVDPAATLGPVHLGRGPDAQLDARVSFWITGVAVIVLLIACANVANLFLARAATQQRELAMRLALGVGRGRLARQLGMESLVLGLLGGIGGMGLAWAAGGTLRALLLPEAAGIAVVSDARTILYTALLAVVAGALTVIVPSLITSRFDIAGALRAGGRGTTRPRTRTQSALVVLQTALSVVLLAGAAVFVLSLQRAQTHRIGLDVDRLVYATVNMRGTPLDDAQSASLIARLEGAARTTAGVTHATMVTSVPFWTNEALGLYVGGNLVNELGRFTFQAGSADYFVATGTRILRGRGFAATDDANGMPVMVVSEGMARAVWPDREAIGQCVSLNAPDAMCRRVIGVAEESSMQSLEPTREYTYYVPVSQFPEALTPDFLIRVSGSPAALAQDVRTQLQPLLPGAAYVSVMPFEEIVAPEYRAWRFGATVFAAFGGLALLLAALGLHSLVAYEVAQREHELGVRMALGATRAEVLRLVLGRGTRLAVIGVGAGLTGALLVSRPLEALMFHQSTRDPLVFASIALVLIAIAGVASLAPGMRATRVDPCQALRAD